MCGFITMHRQLLEWEWYKDTNTKILFIHCLLKANWEDKSWQGKDIKRGQFITSTNNLAKELNMSIKEIRTSISKLEKTNEIIKKGASKYTLLSVVKYDIYQNINSLGANEGQTKGKQRATTNNYNNINNINNTLLSEIKISDVEESMIDYLKIAKEFQQLFIDNLTEKNASIVNQQKATFKNYVDPIRLMIQNQEASVQDLRDVYAYLADERGEFWKANILSTAKLRKQILTLIMSARETKPVKKLYKS
jgi:hypothetical protein